MSRLVLTVGEMGRNFGDGKVTKRSFSNLDSSVVFDEEGLTMELVSGGIVAVLKTSEKVTLVGDTPDRFWAVLLLSLNISNPMICGVESTDSVVISSKASPESATNGSNPNVVLSDCSILPAFLPDSNARSELFLDSSNSNVVASNPKVEFV